MKKLSTLVAVAMTLLPSLRALPSPCATTTATRKSTRIPRCAAAASTPSHLTAAQPLQPRFRVGAVHREDAGWRRRAKGRREHRNSERQDIHQVGHPAASASVAARWNPSFRWKACRASFWQQPTSAAASGQDRGTGLCSPRASGRLGSSFRRAGSHPSNRLKFFRAACIAMDDEQRVSQSALAEASDPTTPPERLRTLFTQPGGITYKGAGEKSPDSAGHSLSTFSRTAKPGRRKSGASAHSADRSGTVCTHSAPNPVRAGDKPDADRSSAASLQPGASHPLLQVLSLRPDVSESFLQTLADRGADIDRLLQSPMQARRCGAKQPRSVTDISPSQNQIFLSREPDLPECAKQILATHSDDQVRQSLAFRDEPAIQRQSLGWTVLVQRSRDESAIPTKTACFCFTIRPLDCSWLPTG